jgi:hypothetical protein
VFHFSLCQILTVLFSDLPISVAARSMAWVCDRLFAGIVGSNPAGGMDHLSVVIGVCCEVGVSASGLSLLHRSPTDCGVSECERKALIIRRPWPSRGCCAREEKKIWL